MVEKSQRRMNATTAGNRAWFAAHRQRIEVLLRKNPRGARLCVLGAGNCNDLDLPELAGHFGEIHLVDLDATATRNATRPLGLANLIVHAGHHRDRRHPFDLGYATPDRCGNHPRNTTGRAGRSRVHGWRVGVGVPKTQARHQCYK